MSVKAIFCTALVVTSIRPNNICVYQIVKLQNDIYFLAKYIHIKVVIQSHIYVLSQIEE